MTYCRDCNHESEEFFDFSSVKNILMMTGSPVLNKPQDLGSQLSLIDPVNFGYERNFLDDYCQQSYYDKRWSFRPGGLERLTSRIADKFVMRDRHSANIVIPPQSIQYHDLVIDPETYPEQYGVMATLNKHAAILLEENKAMPILYIIALITRKRQAACYPEGIEIKNPEGEVIYKTECKESIKVDKLIKENGEWSGLIPELGDERIVVFSQFKGPLKELHKRLTTAGYKVARYDGDTPPDMRTEIQMDFDIKHTKPEDSKYQIVLCNYRTGGVGLNLTGATQVIELDSEWSPGKQSQARGRVDRIGQTKETTVHVIRLAGSIDQWLDQLNEQKADMVEGLENNIDAAQALRDAILGDTWDQ